MIIKKPKKEPRIPKGEPSKPKRRKRLGRRSLSTVKAMVEKGKTLTKSELHVLCFEAWAKLVKHSNDYVCEWCGKPATDAHHMVGRRQGCGLWFSIENGVALCKGCHIHFHDVESHTGWELFKHQRPLSYEFVTTRKKQTTKRGTQEVRDIYADLLEKLSEYEALA